MNISKKAKMLLITLFILAMPILACGPELCQFDDNGNANSCQQVGDAMGLADRIERAGK